MTVRPIFPVLAIALLPFAMLSERDREPPDALPSPIRGPSTVSLIQRHLALVEHELLSHSTDGLSRGQRAARAENVARLREYRLAARFPRNPEPGRRLLFVDREGLPCALASLILRSGRADLVQVVASRRNDGRVFELAADSILGSALAAWLDSAAITVQEAARIQYPGYTPNSGDWETSPPPAPPSRISTSYAVVSGATIGTGVIATVLNAAPRTRWHAAAGVASGAAGLVVGFSRMDDQGSRRALGVVDVIVGGVSAAMGVRSLLSKTVSTAGSHRVVVQPVAEIAPQGQRVGLNVRF